MSLLKRIQDSTLDKDCDVATLLRLCKVFAAEVQAPELAEWADRELNGYESMFLFLVYRHDETKLSYIREKATSLSNTELQEAFEHFAFLTKQYGVSLSDEEFSLCSKGAAKLTRLSFTPEGFRTDLTEIVCLMQRDGVRTAFIHRSIQEFFAAFFLKHLEKEDAVKKIYEGIKGGQIYAWAQELKFLEQIDKYRYIEYYRLPAVRKLLQSCEYNSTGRVPVTKANFLKHLSGQPIVMVDLDRNGAYQPVVLRRDARYTPFTNDVAKLFGRAILIDQELAPNRRSNFNAGLLTLAAFAKKDPEKFIEAHAGFVELGKRLDREQVKLERVLADRSDNFREILFGDLTKIG